MEQRGLDEYRVSDIAGVTALMAAPADREETQQSAQNGKSRGGQVETECAGERPAKRRAGGKLQLVHGSDGAADLPDLPVEAASAIPASINRAARGFKTRDENRAVEQLRANVFADR
jgi:hypothetical protein